MPKQTACIRQGALLFRRRRHGTVGCRFQYRVRIEGQWWDVPDEAVIKEPNRAGRTMVWPIYYNATNHPLRVEVRCFIPGTMT